MSEESIVSAQLADSRAARANDPAGIPSQDERTDSPQSKHSATWWLFVAVFLIYPLSIMPAYVVMLLLRSRGIDVFPVYEVFYRPVIWILQNVGWARRLNDLIEPILRSLVR